jgi:outer membrane immunogenic protein
MRILYLAAAVIAATVSVPAFASGMRVEAHGGYDRVQFAGDHRDGAMYGIGVGYDHAMGAMFVGVEANAEDSSTKVCESDVIVVGDRACARTGRDLSIGVRSGWNLNPTSKLYVLAGYTNARIKVSYTDASGTVSDGANGDGVRVGAGLQYGFGTGLFGKVEYRYSNYESDFSRHQVVAGVGVEF